MGVSAYVFSMQKARRIDRQSTQKLHSRPSYHGLYSLLWVLIAGWGVLFVMVPISSYVIDNALLSRIFLAQSDRPAIEHQLVLSDAKALATGALASHSDPLRAELAQSYLFLSNLRWWLTVALVSTAALVAAGVTSGKISPDWRARNRVENILQIVLTMTAAVAVLTTVGIVLSLIFETVSFFGKINWRLDKFLFGTTWSPLSGVHSGDFDLNRVGAVPLFVGTFLITAIAMVVAVPVGLFAAIYLSEFAGTKTRSFVKPMLEILAGIPTVVYGVFAAITVAPFLRSTGDSFGVAIASESALAAGIVMGIMIIPFISSLSDDVINAVPQSLREGSYGLGATKAETIRQVILPAALPGIVSAVLLGVSRAVGETMIVVMAAGQGANLSVNPFEAVTTVTVQIVMLITGDTEADTAAGPAFTLGFTLFGLTLLMNGAAQLFVRRYRELYD